jgi:hypothetical protein
MGCKTREARLQGRCSCDSDTVSGIPVKLHIGGVFRYQSSLNMNQLQSTVLHCSLEIDSILATLWRTLSFRMAQSSLLKKATAIRGSGISDLGRQEHQDGQTHSFRAGYKRAHCLPAFNPVHLAAI